MKLLSYLSLFAILLIAGCSAVKVQSPEKLVRNGIPWFDDQGNIVNAHGACIVEEGGRYYLFGEWKSDESNAFPGSARTLHSLVKCGNYLFLLGGLAEESPLNPLSDTYKYDPLTDKWEKLNDLSLKGYAWVSCYSSDDLVNWKFENVVLPVQEDGILGPNRVGERVKVMKCPSTGEFVMYMHADDMGYYDPHIGYATSKTIAGDYEFHGPLLFEGEPIRRWDMGTFQER